MSAVFLNSNSEAIASRLLSSDLVLVTPSDDEQTYVVLEFWPGSTAGDIKVTTLNGSTLVIPNVQVGQKVSVPCITIWSSGTTATGIVGVI